MGSKCAIEKEYEDDRVENVQVFVSRPSHGKWAPCELNCREKIRDNTVTIITPAIFSRFLPNLAIPVSLSQPLPLA